MKQNPYLINDDTTRHSLFNLNYKVVCKVTDDYAINERINYLFHQSAKRLAFKYHVDITGWAWQSDRISMRIHCRSLLLVRRFVETFKQVSSTDYHHIVSPKHHKTIWGQGFCLTTVGSRAKQTIQKYLSK